MTEKNQTISNPGSHLDSVVSNLPWGDAFDIGLGLNAVTGEVLGAAIKKPNIKDEEVKSSQYYYHFISTEAELEQQIEVSAKGKYNMDGVNLSASASYLNQIKFSETSITLIAHYSSTFSGYDEADKYELTDEALKLIEDKDKFREIYGDYFVAGHRRGSRFTAVFRCETKSASQLHKFRATVGADTPDVFSAEGSVKFKNAATENDVNISIKVEAVGYKGVLPAVPEDPEGIIKLLEWFKENELGVPVRAKLYHFSQLYSGFSAEVPIAPATFVALNQLYLTHWKIKNGLASIPSYYQKQYETEVSNFESELNAYSNTLAKNTTEREKLMLRANALYEDLRAVLERQDFYFSVAGQVAKEPKKDKLITCVDCGPKAWLYGYSTYNQSNAVSIHSIKKHYNKKWGPTVRAHTFNIDPDQTKLIVGWEIRGNLSNAGEWKKISDQVILKNSASVWAQSDFWGDFDWTLHIYYVDAADYIFD